MKERLRRHLHGRWRVDEVAIARTVLPRRGTMVDVGAHVGSSCLPYARDGWAVLAFEPDPVNRAELERQVRQSGDRVKVDPRAVSDETGATVTLYRSPVSTGISALTAFHETHVPAVTVTTTSLRDALGEAGIETVELLKIDAEGHDLFVLRGVPWEKITPDVVICEFEDRKTVPQGHTWQDIAEFLRERGYTVLVSEWYPVEEYGREHRFRDVHAYPCQLDDPRGWGNLVAVRTTDQARVISRKVRSLVRRQRLLTWTRRQMGTAPRRR